MMEEREEVTDEHGKVKSHGRHPICLPYFALSICFSCVEFSWVTQEEDQKGLGEK